MDNLCKVGTRGMDQEEVPTTVSPAERVPEDGAGRQEGTMRTRMTTGAAALAVLLLGACGPEATSRGGLLEPAADMATQPASTATATIDGKEYTYGCPNFPCPVLELVTEHIERGLFFWLTPIGGQERIYLYVLTWPVVMTPVEKDPLPPIVIEPDAPSLTGPVELHGRFYPPMNVLVCRDFTLELISPDGGLWSFMRGEMTFEYMKDSEAGWIASGETALVPFGAGVWSQLLSGEYVMLSTVAFPPAYDVHFNVLLQRKVGDQSFEYTVEHELMCGSEEYYEPEPPPEARLTGPEMVKGRKYPDLYPDLGIVCKNFDLELNCEGEAEWAYAGGQMVLENLR